jgi:hypothetical protein
MIKPFWVWSAALWQIVSSKAGHAPNCLLRAEEIFQIKNA